MLIKILRQYIDKVIYRNINMQTSKYIDNQSLGKKTNK